MENVVVDSSVAIKWFVVEPYADEARKILDGYKAGDINLLAPDLLNAELSNKLPTSVIRDKVIDPAAAGLKSRFGIRYGVWWVGISPVALATTSSPTLRGARLADPQKTKTDDVVAIIRPGAAATR